MKLAYPLLDKPLETEENKVSVLIIENAVELRRAVEMLKQQISGADGDFVLSENGGIIELSKKADIVTDMFELQLDSKKLSAKINQYAVRAAAEHSEHIGRIIGDINMLAAEISTEMEFDASFNALEDAEGLIKLLGFHADAGTVSLPERLAEYMRIYRLFFGISLFVFYGLKALLSEEELVMLYRTAAYEKLNMLLIEDCQRGSLPEYEKTVIIDRDLCIF